MKKITGSIIGTIFLIGVLGVVALFIGSANSTLAHNQLGREQVIPLLDTDHSEYTAQLSTSVPEIGEPREIIAQEVQDLSQQWHASNKKAGWIHIVSHWQMDYDEIGVAPDGKSMEKEYVNDEWYLLDERGHIKNQVLIQRDINGSLIQVSALRDNTGYNLTYGIKISMPDEAIEFVWDFGFPREATRLAGSLEKENISLKGQSRVLYTVTEEYPSPIDFYEFNEPVTAVITRAYYEPENGKLLSIERVMNMSSDEERINPSVKLVSWETGVQPPAEVLAYLDATYEDTFIHPSELTNSPEKEEMQ